MNKFQSTKGKLFHYAKQVQHLEATDSILLHMNVTWIKYFKKHNFDPIMDLNKAMIEIDKEYYKQEGTEYVKENGKFVFKEGKTEAEYNAAMAKLHAEPITIVML